MRAHVKKNMKARIREILELAEPFLNTRKNDIHTRISINLAFQLARIENGDLDIVFPAIILHDVGWKKVPEELQLNAFGPNASSPELNRTHELEGVKIAKEILSKVSYDPYKTSEIIEIIDGHDSRKTAISLNDSIVKDADKLWRYSKEGFFIDTKRFGETPEEGLGRLRTNLDTWFFTNSARALAEKELTQREKELKEEERPNPIRGH
jgi:HD superfamily phosphodiesterase